MDIDLTIRETKRFDFLKLSHLLLTVSPEWMQMWGDQWDFLRHTAKA
jgi:hypothetical protein